MPPSIVLVAGPNGAGKSTLAPFLLRDALAVSEFVNADRIAQGCLMLARLDELARQRATFAFRVCSLRGREPAQRPSLTGCFGMSSCNNGRSHDRAT
jgi:ABC-type hemin transport system ATPase subunit